MSSTTLAFSPATSSINRPRSNASFPSSSSAVAVSSLSVNKTSRKGCTISCEVAVKSSNSTASVGLDTSPSVSDEKEVKIGAKVKVKVPLKVYHVPRVPEVDLTGMEGVLKQYVAVFKGKKISANMPYKVEFVTDVEGRGPVKFFAHLKEDDRIGMAAEARGPYIQYLFCPYNCCHFERLASRMTMIENGEG